MRAEDTRTRIVEATAELHEEVGPAATTVTAIAERAGVQRLTVYRHFPHQKALIHACSAHWREDHPLPEPSTWSGIPDPRRRLSAALRELYAYFRNGAPMLERILRDEGEVPELAEVMAPWWAYMREVASGLATGWGVAADRQRLIRAAAGHALRFGTWRSLSEEGCSDEEAVELMVGFISRLPKRDGGQNPAFAGGPGLAGHGSADPS